MLMVSSGAFQVARMLVYLVWLLAVVHLFLRWQKRAVLPQTPDIVLAARRLAAY